MKNKFITNTLFPNVIKHCSGILWVALIVSLVSSCKPYNDFVIQPAGKLALSASKSSIVLTQKTANEKALDFSWTTGNNQGSGGSISYKLQIDKNGNSFATPLVFDMGK